MIEIILGKEYPNKVIPLIKNAKHSIKIVMFDWRWYPDYIEYPIQQFNVALLQAHKIGVKVSAITNFKDIADRLQKLGMKSKHLVRNRLVHTKLMIIDDEIAIIGSHNFTNNAFSHNFEISVIVDEKSEIERLTKLFNDMLCI